MKIIERMEKLMDNKKLYFHKKKGKLVKTVVFISLSEPSRPVSKNMITNYSGHVPGFKYKHGASFSVLTKSKIF